MDTIRTESNTQGVAVLTSGSVAIGAAHGDRLVRYGFDLREVETLPQPRAARPVVSHSSTADPELPAIHVFAQDSMAQDSLNALIETGQWRIESCDSVESLLQCATGAQPSCLVLDVRLPGTDGLALQQQLASAGLATSVVFLSSRCDVPTAVRAMKAGAVDMLVLPFRGEELAVAIDRALATSRAMARERARTRALQERQARLTPREREVMVLVASGLMNKHVAAELDISEITVKAHRGKVMRKMAARSLAALVDMARHLGMTATLN